MNKREIPLIALAVFGIIILLSFDNLESAYALTQNLDMTLTGADNQCAIMQGSSRYVCIPEESSSTSHVLSYFDSDSENPEVETITIYAQNGGCDPISNPCNADSGSASCTNCNWNMDGQSGRPNPISFTLKGIWCGITDCFTWQSNSAGYSEQLLRITLVGAQRITGYMNETSTTTVLNSIWGIDLATGGIGGISVFTVRCTVNPCINTSLGTLFKTGGTSLMADVGSVTTNQFFIGSASSAQGWGITNVDGCWFCGGITTDKNVVVSSKQANGNTNRAITIINAETMTEICGASTNSQALTTGQNTGLTKYAGNTRNQWIMAQDANIYTIGLETCAKADTTSYATLSLANYISSIAIDNTESLFWIHHGSAQAQSTITQANLTTFNTLVDFDSVIGASISGYISGSNGINSLVADTTSHTLLRTDSTVKAQILYLDNFIPASSPSSGVCPVGTALDCVGGNSAWSGIVPADQNATEIVGSITDGLGLTECGDSGDAETCGSGLFLFLFVLLLAEFLSLAGYLGFARKANAEVRLMDIGLVMLIIAFAVIALGFYLNWIPDLVFYTIVVLVAGLLTFGLIKHFRGG